MPDKNPQVYYGTAFLRHLETIWNTRITHPREDILQACDNISAAFHRVLYHPEMAILFASVWDDKLVVPVGSIFGACFSPGFYMKKGEIRSHFTHSHPDPTSLPLTDLARALILPPPPTRAETAEFDQAVADTIHKGLSNPKTDPPERRQVAYVDDLATAHIPRFIRSLVNTSVIGAYIIFGFPEEDPNRPPPINPQKWNDKLSHLLYFLGYEIDSRKMIVIWPIAKREKLIIFLNDIINPLQQNPPQNITPRACTRVLGLIRHAAVVSSTGHFRSLRFQFLFNDIVSKAPGAHKLRRWYQRKLVSLPPDVLTELIEFRDSIKLDLYAPGWSRRIGLIINRDPTITLLTDASSNGLGGWSAESELSHMWQITVGELVTIGLN
jgi:hypothetical protein